MINVSIRILSAVLCVNSFVYDKRHFLKNAYFQCNSYCINRTNHTQISVLQILRPVTQELTSLHKFRIINLTTLSQLILQVVMKLGEVSNILWLLLSCLPSQVYINRSNNLLGEGGGGGWSVRLPPPPFLADVTSIEAKQNAHSLTHSLTH